MAFVACQASHLPSMAQAQKGLAVSATLLPWPSADLSFHGDPRVPSRSVCPTAGFLLAILSLLWVSLVMHPSGLLPLLLSLPVTSECEQDFVS